MHCDAVLCEGRCGDTVKSEQQKRRGLQEGAHLDDPDFLEAFPAELLCNDLASAASLIKQQNLGPFVHLLQRCNL